MERHGLRDLSRDSDEVARYHDDRAPVMKLGK